MGQPPGKETLASPWRASMGPSSRTDARVVWAVCVGNQRRTQNRHGDADGIAADLPLGADLAQGGEHHLDVLHQRHIAESRCASALRHTAASSGRAAFLAPETATLPVNGRPPWIEMMMFCML